MDDGLKTYIKLQEEIGQVASCASRLSSSTDLYKEFDGEDEDTAEGYGGSGFKCETKSKNHTDQIQSKLCERYKQLLLERQEIKRRNIYLQKKMVEFCKKRKMDHVLKEDPKGLDVESKYLKRLFELEQQRLKIDKAEKDLRLKISDLHEKTTNFLNSVQKFQEDYLDRQRKVAEVLEIKKTKKRISTRAIANFISQQAHNAEEISKLRFDDIRKKRLLVQRQDLAKSLDSLGHGLRRADFEKLKFEFQNRCKILEDKAEDVEQLQMKVSAEGNNLKKVQLRARHVDALLDEYKQRFQETKFLVIETQQRLQKLSRICRSVRDEQEKLQNKAGLLAHMSLITEYDKCVAESQEIWRKLQKAEIIYKSRLIHDRGGLVSTPTELSDAGFTEMFGRSNL